MGFNSGFKGLMSCPLYLLKNGHSQFHHKKFSLASRAVTGPRISLRALMASHSLVLYALLAQFFNLDVWKS